MLYFPTIMSVLEVLAVTIPVLLTVAFVTVAERKTMASMQRRVGPNAVGCTNCNLTFKRFYHSSCDDLRELYRNRIAPVIEFADHVLFTCTDLLNSSLVNSFFKPLKGKGGVFICLDIKKIPIFFI
jgi:NADH:ubiquinone oxidoreductase subunit H